MKIIAMVFFVTVILILLVGQSQAACNATITQGNPYGTITISGANTWANLSCINATLNNASAIQNVSNEWIIKVPIIQSTATNTLYINNSDAYRVKLISMNFSGNANDSYIELNGISQINNVTITSWNISTSGVAPVYTNRSYLRFKTTSCVNISSSNLSYLGWGNSASPFGKTGVFYDTASNTETSCGFVNNSIFSYNGVGLMYHTTINGSIKNNTFANNNGEGLYLYRSNNFTVDNNTAFLNNRHGIGVGGGGASSPVDNITLSNNYNISNNPNSADTNGFGFYLDKVQNLSVINNHDIYNVYDGIGCNYCQNVTISGNYNIHDVDVDDGILLYLSNKSRVINNYNFWNNRNGIVVDGKGTSSSYNNTVSNNTNNSGVADLIHINATNTSLISNNEVKDSTTYQGIAVKYSFNNTIQNNVVYGHALRGIYSYLSSNNTYLNNQVFSITTFKDYNFEGSWDEIIRNPANTSLYILAQLSTSNITLEFTDNRIFNATTETNLKTYYPAKSNLSIGNNWANITVYSGSIIPSLNFIIVNITTWNTTGDYHKTFNVSENTAFSANIGGNPPDKYMDVLINGTQAAQVLTDGSGYLSNNYVLLGTGTTQIDIVVDPLSPSTISTKNTYYNSVDAIFAFLVVVVVAYLGFVAISFILPLIGSQQTQDFSVIIDASVGLGTLVVILGISIFILKVLSGA